MKPKSKSLDIEIYSGRLASLIPMAPSSLRPAVETQISDQILLGTREEVEEYYLDDATKRAGMMLRYMMRMHELVIEASWKSAVWYCLILTDNMLYFDLILTENLEGEEDTIR
jgi:hypothetical protein